MWNHVGAHLLKTSLSSETKKIRNKTFKNETKLQLVHYKYLAAKSFTEKDFV